MVKLSGLSVVVGVFIAMLSMFVPGWPLRRNTTIEYRATEEVFANPLMGYAPPADSSSRYPDSSLVYVDITWRELEPEEGSYNWEQIAEENHLTQWQSQGKHIVLRFVCDIPSKESHMDIPDWLYERTGKDGIWYEISYGKGYAPNYNNQVLIRCHARAIAALGEYLGQSGFVRYVELGSLGHWGEWHVRDGSGLPGIPFEPVRIQYVQPYKDAFPNARLLMRRPFAEAPEGCGVYNDMVGEPESTAEWLAWIREGGIYSQTGEQHGLKAMPEVWNMAPVGGEFTSSIDMDSMMNSNRNQTVELLKKSHMTFIGPKIPPTNDGRMEMRDEQLLYHVGYRYRVKSMQISRSRGAVILSLLWRNDGVAPIYWPWKACLYLERLDGGMERKELDVNLMDLTQGKEMVTSITLSDSNLDTVYRRIMVGIENPETGEPSVYLPMNAKRDGTRSVLWENQKE